MAYRTPHGTSLLRFDAMSRKGEAASIRVWRHRVIADCGLLRFVEGGRSDNVIVNRKFHPMWH
jgi:hypothetical protein